MIFATPCIHTAIGDLVEVTDYLLDLEPNDIHKKKLLEALRHPEVKQTGVAERIKTE